MERTMKDLFIDELHDILNAEHQIIKALPEVISATDSTTLKNAFENHLKETKGQVQRLEKILVLRRFAW